jgi:hypothetical protein
MCRDVTEWPDHYESYVEVVEQDGDGGGIKLRVLLSDANKRKAKDLMTAMRFCGFVGGIVTDELESVA